MERAALGRQCHLDTDAAGIDLDGVDQAQVHDRHAELGIEDLAQRLGDLLPPDGHTTSVAGVFWNLGERCPRIRRSTSAKARAPSASTAAAARIPATPPTSAAAASSPMPPVRSAYAVPSSHGQERSAKVGTRSRPARGPNARYQTRNGTILSIMPTMVSETQPPRTMTA